MNKTELKMNPDFNEFDSEMRMKYNEPLRFW